MSDEIIDIIKEICDNEHDPAYIASERFSHLLQVLRTEFKTISALLEAVNDIMDESKCTASQHNKK